MDTRLNAEKVSVFSVVKESHAKRHVVSSLFMEVVEHEKLSFGKQIVKIRSKRIFVISIASSSIVALLLPSGRTVHSVFKIPLDLKESSCCIINRCTNLKNLILQASVFV